MPKFAANLSMLFVEYPFLDRFSEAAGAGFKAVECQFPYDHSPQEISDCLNSTGLELIEYSLTLALALVAMDCCSKKSGTFEMLHHLVGTILRPGEGEGPIAW